MIILMAISYLELIKIFEKVFNGEAFIENEQWQIEKPTDDKLLAANSKGAQSKKEVRYSKEEEEAKSQDAEFKIDLVALSNSMYLNTK